VSIPTLEPALRALAEAKAAVAAALVVIVTARVREAVVAMPWVAAAYVSTDGTGFTLVGAWSWKTATETANLGVALSEEIGMGVFVGGDVEEDELSIPSGWTCVFRREAKVA